MVRRLFLAALVVGLGVAAGAGWLLFTAEPEHEPPEVLRAGVVGATDDGWQRLGYRDSRLEVPTGWAPLDTTECELPVEHWGPAEADPCGEGPGVWFYAAATYDAATGPGAHRLAANDDLPDGGWAGYVVHDPDVMYVQDVDAEVVRRVLHSVSQPAAVEGVPV
jgi:hypothetical protein